LQFSFGPAPLRRFDIRGELGPDLSFRPGVASYAEAVCATVPNYGPELAFTGICNPSGILAASGTLLSRRYRGPAHVRPSGVRVRSLRLIAPRPDAPGRVDASLTGPALPSAARHVAAILLADAATGTPITLDCRADTSVAVDRRGQIAAVHLSLPAGTRLQARVRAYVILDAFAIATRLLAR
jgi:hypothetical protein